VGRRLGLIIGINSYQDAAFRPLQFAETDARALAQWLVHARGGQWNPADVQVMLGAQATHELIESLITQICLHMAGPEDLVLIYFAGHAFVDQASGDGYLAGCNTHAQQSSSGIHLFSLASQVMARSSAAQILCIFDCFQSGPAWSMRRGSQFDYKPLLGPTLQNGLQQMQGRLLYCSCRGNELSPEKSEKNLGSFMYGMIMGVGGPAIDPANGQITLQHLHQVLTERLSEQHRPQIFGNEPRPLILVGEMPSFMSSTGALDGGHASGMLGGQMAGSGVGQGSAMNPNLFQQCQQMLKQAQQLVTMQQLQQAYQLTESILQMNPTFVEALILKAQILGAIGQFPEALDTIKQVVRIAPDNALGWSMAAALLANTGQLPEAMSAADRSLSLDPSNTETISIKAMIREKLADDEAQTGKRSRLLPPVSTQPRDTGKSFALAAGIQALALFVGVIGVLLPLLSPGLLKLIPLILDSVALAVLLVNAWRGTFLYGAKRFLLTFGFSILAFIILALFASGLVSTRLAVKPVYNFIIDRVSTQFSMMTPLVFMIIFLAAATILPLLTALIGLIAGAIVRSARKSK
jgi:tetratricopeptide (TPR) repeat protein